MFEIEKETRDAVVGFFNSTNRISGLHIISQQDVAQIQQILMSLKPKSCPLPKEDKKKKDK